MRLCIILLLFLALPVCAIAQPAESSVPLDTVSMVKPEYPGGEKQLMQYLSLNLHYPCEAMAKRVQGEVIICFVIGPDGTVSDIKTLNKIGHGCDEEAERVVKNMPAWQPASLNGKAIAVNYKLPVVFELPAESQ